VYDNIDNNLITAPIRFAKKICIFGWVENKEMNLKSKIKNNMFLNLKT